jgi:hypothetical protein
MWVRKDERNVKLQTFLVGPTFRGSAIGQHLLYHELMTWARDPQIERVYVTVASSKVELIEYFHRFGFRVEGVAANRYQRASNAAELVMAKHLVRKTVRDSRDLPALADDLARKVWGIDPQAASAERFGVPSSHLSLPVIFPQISMFVDSSDSTVTARIRLVDDHHNVVRSYDDASLMREFHPLRLHLTGKQYVLVPIFPKWVEGMFATAPVAGHQMDLKLRVDNVYYCYPKIRNLTVGDLVIFYETKKKGGRGVAIGGAIVREVNIAPPAQLHGRFAKRGVYTLADVQRHERDGKVMAIYFELFEEFLTQVNLQRIRTIRGDKTNIQGLTPVRRDHFEQIRDEGVSKP